MAASDASSSGKRQRRSRRDRPVEHEVEPRSDPMNNPGLDQVVEPAPDEIMERPAMRPEPSEREDVMCVGSFASIQEQPPLHHRRGLATIRPREVDRKGAARLLCDGLHDGPHRWPPVYDPLVPPADDEDLSSDSGDEGEIVVE